MVRVTEETLAEIIEIVDTAHNKWFIREGLAQATHEIATTMLENDGVCVALECAITQAATSGPMV